jgi:restriction system protein
VQCKPWNAYRVGINPVRGLLGAMASGNVGEGVLVTAGKFTQEARDFAGKEKISLIDGAELLGKIAALVPEKALDLLEVATQGDFQTPTCPSCGVKMISRKSTKQGRKFWGCRNYPRCKQTFFDAV